MTTPGQQEQAALEDLTTALAYAQSASAVTAALAAFPDVAEAAIKALFDLPAVRALIRVAPRVGAHSAEHAMYRQNLMRRAAYLVSAVRRLSAAVRRRELPQAIVAERRYLTQHLDATAKRVQAARLVAKEAKARARAVQRVNEANGVPLRPTGPDLLGWYTTLDDRTSAECREANGRNFDPRQIPPIGYPGAVHPACRCRPGPAHRSRLRVEDLQAVSDARVAEIAAARYDGPSGGSGWVVRGGIV